MDTAIQGNGRCDECVAGRAVVAHLHAATHGLRQIVPCEDRTVNPHIASDTVIVAIVLKIGTEGFNEVVAVHVIHKLIEHFNHVGLCGAGSLFHVGVIAGDGLEGNQNVGVKVVCAVFHDCVKAQCIGLCKRFHLDGIVD